jgi:hypothetical protein
MPNSECDFECWKYIKEKKRTLNKEAHLANDDDDDGGDGPRAVVHRTMVVVDLVADRHSIGASLCYRIR